MPPCDTCEIRALCTRHNPAGEWSPEKGVEVCEGNEEE